MKKNRYPLAGAFVALAVLAFAGVHPALAWQIVTNISIPSYATASVAVNPALNNIYLSGGFSSAQPIVVVNGATFGQTSVGSGMGADVDVTNNNYWSGGCYSDKVTAWNSANTALASPSTGCGCSCFTSVDAPHRRVWVGAQCCDSIYVFNADTYALVAGPISPNGVGGTVLANPATGRAYFTSNAGSQRVNPSTFAVTANSFGSVFSVNASANLLYATPNDNVTIQIINGAPDPEVVLTNITMPFPFGGGEYMRYCVNPVLNRIYIGCNTNGTIAILNATTGQNITSFSLGAGVTSVGTIAVDASRNLVYAIANQGSSAFLYVIQDSALSVSPVSSNDPVMQYPYHLASDGVNLFVTGTGSNSSQFVFKLPATGGAASVVYNAYNPAEIALLGTNLFWIDPNAGPIGDTEILKAPTNGSGPVTKIYIGSNVGQPIVDGVGLTSDGSVLYAADEVNGTVWRLNPDGSGLTQLGPNRYSGYFSTEQYNSIAVNEGILYIADSGQHGVSPQVVSIPTNGGSFTTLASGAPFVNPSGIAIGGGMIFVSDPSASNTIWQMPIGGGTPTVLVSGAPFVSINGLCFVNGTLYVVDTGAGAIYAINFPKPAISAQPVGTTATTGGKAVLTVAAAGESPFTYQWQLNGTNVPGATNSTLTISGFSAANAGLYTVIISNVWGSVTSAEVSVAGVDIKQFAGVIVNGLPGLSYTVQSSPTLGAGAVWTTLTNVTLVTNPYIYIDYTSLTNHQQFFRVLPAP